MLSLSRMHVILASKREMSEDNAKVIHKSVLGIFKKYLVTIVGLDQKSVNENPFVQFDKWFSDAIKAKIDFYEAMTLGTVSPEGQPSARVVLLKHFDEKGFVFYTNYNSRKANELDTSGLASLLFFWPDLNRQVRIEGSVEKVSEVESDTYFHSRPKGSRIGAWASPQSEKISVRKDLAEKVAEIKRKFSGEKIPRPDFWGGYRVIPTKIEFWQARADRLHDRILYERKESNEWRISRLAP